MAESWDALVVGAGLSGIAAADALERGGARVVICEAGEEVGGRTRSRRIDGQVVDLGGEMLGSYYSRLPRLAARLGLSVVPAGLLRAPVRWRRDDAPGTRWVPRIAPRDLPAALRIYREIERLAAPLD